MPGQNYVDIANRLRAAGLAGETPCAVVSCATTKYQRTHRTTVFDLPRAPQLASPTLLIVGEVVRFSDPAAVVGEFVAPSFLSEKDNALPAALFRKSISQVSSR
jgi:siroheme synthase